MKNDEFVDGIKIAVRDSAIKSVKKILESPPGRKPRERLVNTSQWYKTQTDKDRSIISNIIEESIDMSLFGFFCVLDHVRTIEGVGEKTTFELYAVKNGERVLINDPNKEELHNLYNSLVLEQD